MSTASRKRKRNNKRRARAQSTRAKLRLKPHSLYYLRIDRTTAQSSSESSEPSPVYKIGISSNLIDRIAHLYKDYSADSITLIFSEKFPNKWEAEDAETLVKELYQEHTGVLISPILTSETFGEDILEWYHSTRHQADKTSRRTYTARDFERCEPNRPRG